MAPWCRWCWRAATGPRRSRWRCDHWSAQTYPRWECIVVDDGSKEDLAGTVARVADGRIRVHRGRWPRGSGSPQPRPRRGERRDRHLPRLRQLVVPPPAGDDRGGDGGRRRLGGRPAAGAQGRRPGGGVRADDQPLDRLDQHNIGRPRLRRRAAGAIRSTRTSRACRTGSLVRRLAATDGRRCASRTSGQVYDERSPGRISTQSRSARRTTGSGAQAIGQPAAGLRVLLAEWHYPQITETYIEAAVAGCARSAPTSRCGPRTDVAVPYEPVIPRRTGARPRRRASRRCRPDLVLTHWLHVGPRSPATSRPPGRARTRSSATASTTTPASSHELLARAASSSTSSPTWSAPGRPDRTVVRRSRRCSTPSAGPPPADKDRRLVLRMSAGLLTKDLDTFLLAANLCPEHGSSWCSGTPCWSRSAPRSSSSAPAELGPRPRSVIDLEHDEVAAPRCRGRASTCTPTAPTTRRRCRCRSPRPWPPGAWVLGRDLPGVGGLHRPRRQPLRR